MRKPISVPGSRQSTAPLSNAMLADGRYVFVSGQAPIDPKSGELLLGSLKEQAELVFSNVGALLKAAGTSWDQVVMTRVFLDDRKYFAEMNGIYREYFSEPYPARTTIAVGLPLEGMLIEVDCIALVP